MNKQEYQDKIKGEMVKLADKAGIAAVEKEDGNLDGFFGKILSIFKTAIDYGFAGGITAAEVARMIIEETHNASNKRKR